MKAGAIGIIFLALTVTSCSHYTQEPNVAGSFYPAKRAELEEAVRGYLGRAENNPVEGRLIALVSPHAGYVFSGQVAAYGYRRIKGAKTVVIIGESHHYRYLGASVYAKGRLKTPLGGVKVDQKLAGALLNPAIGIGFHPEYYEKEHSIEVQLPFLQEALGDFEVVPILISMPSNEMYAYLANTLTALLREKRDVVIVASTDLSHYHDYETAVGMDTAVIEAMGTLYGPDLERTLSEGKGEMCGSPAVLLALEVARRLGANNSVLFKYANSGDVTGDRSSVVGYASMGFYRSPLPKDDKVDLLAIARKAIVERVKYGKASEAHAVSPGLNAYGAAFVTIKRDGRLRGCIGHVVPVAPLFESVKSNAVAASSYDRRFPPMQAYELMDMEVEISVLTPLSPMNDPSEVEVGRHGLYLEKGDKSGLLLPQVAAEQGWDRDTFLRQVSVKAGLPEDGWRTADRIFTFEAEVISEKDYGKQLGREEAAK